MSHERVVYYETPLDQIALEKICQSIMCSGCVTYFDWGVCYSHSVVFDSGRTETKWTCKRCHDRVLRSLEYCAACTGDQKEVIRCHRKHTDDGCPSARYLKTKRAK